MEQLTQYIEKFKDGLPELFENVLTSYQDKINSDFADEYHIPEHEYVQSHPLLQLNDKLFGIDSKERYNFTFNNTVFFKNNKVQSDMPRFRGPRTDLAFIDIYSHQSNNNLYFNDKVYYKYDKIVPKNEYVIAFIIDHKFRYDMDNQGLNEIINYMWISVIYITNYGRFIKVCRGPRYKDGVKYLFTNKEDECIFINNKKLYLQEYPFQPGTCKKDKSGYPKLLTDPEINLAPLTYKFPKLFLDVINAFRNESTDDMQKCCEKYNILLQKANSTNKYDKTIQSLEEENAKLKSEIELLKLQMEEQRKHFMG